MCKYIITSFILFLTLQTTVFAEEGTTRKIMISPALYSLDVTHDGKSVTIVRNQNQKNIISTYYQPTYRGKIQPIAPFKPHAVETIGALELIDYLQQKESGDESILIIDSRTKAWVKRGTIPGTINIPFTEFKEGEHAVEVMEEQFDVLITDSALDFTNAKTIVMYCNGIWCGQSPTAIKKLLRYGYPAARIKYFRGGMQNWESLGLTVVKPSR